MALRNTTAFLLTLNIVFFALVSSDPLPDQPTCAANSVNFGACAGLLNNFLNGIVVGSVPTSPCCGLLGGLINLEAAACLCTTIKANLLGVNLDTSAGFSLVLNNCGTKVPAGFRCY